MITQQEYQQRRQNLARQLESETVAIIPAAQELLRNGDAHYRFRQASDFYYLTGFEEPDAVLIILSGDTGESYLFNRSRNPEQEQWTGKRLGQNAAVETLGVRAAYPIEELGTQLQQLLAAKKGIYWNLGQFPQYEKIIFDAVQYLKKQVRRGITAPTAFYELDPLLSEMRLFKSDSEIALMRRAAAISIAAHKKVMKICPESNYEYELEAALLYAFSRQGCRAPAYDPIVGSGGNACILHYTANNNALSPGDLVLIDAGGEYQNYASDITRTIPINGRFNDAQRAIYELVLKAQRSGIECIKPGVEWTTIQKIMVKILTAGLCELGILQGDLDTLILSEAYKPFYMHNSGHWLGLDVHDAGRYKLNNTWRALEPGMVLTVEPGLYIQANMPGVDQKWWNIGVRIEDDILVTKDGYENLTADLPVEVSEIEKLMLR